MEKARLLGSWRMILGVGVGLACIYTAHTVSAVSTPRRLIATEGIYLHDSRSGELLRDLRGAGDEVYCPAWSADGRWLSYAQKQVGDTSDTRNEGISIVRPDGTGVRRITTGPDATPCWSPDGQRIAFARFVTRDQERGRICVVDLATCKVNELTDDRSLNTQPSWSPDGRSIVFTSNRSGIERLWVLPLAPGRSTLAGPPRLIPHQPGGHCGFPDWSPDGRAILFLSSPDDLYGYPAHLYTIASDGSHRRFLPITHVIADHVAWSPDGKQIALLRALAPRDSGLFVASSQGKSVRMLEHNKTIAWPEW